MLTRLPAPSRRTAGAVSRLLARNFPYPVHLEPDRAAALFDRLPHAGPAGGAVYDALVGAAAVQAGVPLVSRDRRALGTYRAPEVDVVLVG